MPVGRPTKYKPEYCEQIIKYFDVEHTNVISVTVTYKNGDTREEERVVANDLPTFQRFSYEIGVCTDTLHEWKKVHPEFSEAYKRAQELQEAMWLTNSMKGLYPGAFTIFAGKNMFGWRDKQEVEHSGGVDINPAAAFLDALRQGK